MNSTRATVPAPDAGVVTDLHAVEGERLYDFARHLGLSDEDAADVVQESLVRLWGELRRGISVTNPAGWAYRTCYRLSMNQHRRRRRLARLLPRLAPQHTAYAGPDASDRLSVWQAVDQLSSRQREVVYLHYAADLPFDEVGGALGISASAARTHASRAMAAIRSQLEYPKEAR